MRNEIDQELGNWDKDATIVKHKIYEATIDSNIKRRLFNWKPFITIVATFILAVGAYLMWPTLTGEKTNQANDSEAPAPIIDSSEIRKPAPLIIGIAKYNLFYNDTLYRTEKEAERTAIFDVLEWYTLINHLEEYGVTWPEDRREFYRQRSEAELKELKKKETFQKFYTILQSELGVTDEDYIEYLLVQYEYNMLDENMFRDRVGLQADGSYPSDYGNEEYMNEIGITDKMLNELAEEIEREKLENQIDSIDPIGLPTGIDYEYDKVGLNENNEYIFIEPSYLDPKYLFAFSPNLKKISDITRGFYRQDVNRMNIQDYLQYLNEYEAKDEEEKKIVQDLIFVTEMIIRSIELTMEGE